MLGFLLRPRKSHLIQTHAQAVQAYQKARKDHHGAGDAYEAARSALHQRLRVGA